MKRNTVVRTLEFDAAHRVMNHESKCATLHGHRYKVEIFAEADDLDTLGRVIDFSVLKEQIGGWIDSKLDHTSIICKDDIETCKALNSIPYYKPPVIVQFNPTAENLSKWFLTEFQLLVPQILITKVVVWETPNCRAESSL